MWAFLARNFLRELPRRKEMGEYPVFLRVGGANRNASMNKPAGKQLPQH